MKSLTTAQLTELKASDAASAWSEARAARLVYEAALTAFEARKAEFNEHMNTGVDYYPDAP